MTNGGSEALRTIATELVRMNDREDRFARQRPLWGISLVFVAMTLTAWVVYAINASG